MYDFKTHTFDSGLEENRQLSVLGFFFRKMRTSKPFKDEEADFRSDETSRGSEFSEISE